MATLPMAMDILLMDMLTMATIMARGLLMPSLDIIIMDMDTLPMDTDMAITMARGLLSLDMAMDMDMVMDMAMVMDTTTMARGLLSLDMAMDMLMAMVMDTIAMVMASRFILNIPLKSSDVIPKNML